MFILTYKELIQLTNRTPQHHEMTLNYCSGNLHYGIVAKNQWAHVLAGSPLGQDNKLTELALMKGEPLHCRVDFVQNFSIIWVLNCPASEVWSFIMVEMPAYNVLRVHKYLGTSTYLNTRQRSLTDRL